MENDKLRQRVLKNYTAFTRDVDPDLLSDHLIEKSVISIEQWQDICGKNPAPRHRCRALLNFLLTGNDPRAFLVVRKLLKKENHYLLGKIDDESSGFTEDQKTTVLSQFQLQNQIELTQMQEKRLQEAQSENDKLRRRVAELEAELARYHLKESMQSNQTHSEKEIYSSGKYRNATVGPSGGQLVKCAAERSGSAMNLTEYYGENSAVFKPVGSRLSFGQVPHGHYAEAFSAHYHDRGQVLRGRDRSVASSSTADRFGTQQTRSETPRRLSSPSPTPKNATLRSSGRRSPLGSRQYDATDCTADPYLIKEIKTRTSKGNRKAINGIAILNDEVFVISRLSSNIEVHDTYRFTLIRLIGLKISEAPWGNPWDIVSCRINQCLYIMNWKEGNSKAILRIDSKGNVIKQWSTGINCGRLSITQDSNIILTTYKSDKIIEYTAEGGLVCEIKLPYRLAHPQHAIKLHGGRFLVIHGINDDFQQRVCLLDDIGRVLASFGGEKGSGRDHLHGPIHMAVDRSGTVFVAEYSNGRVLLLSQSLKIIRVLLSKEVHGLRYPWSLHLDEANGRLFVADNDYEESKNLLKDGRILVFYIKSLNLLLAEKAEYGVNSAGVLRFQSYF